MTTDESAPTGRLFATIVCLLPVLLGGRIIVAALQPPKGHPHEWGAIGAAYLAILFGAPLVGAGLGATIGLWLGHFWRGLIYGLVVGILPLFLTLALAAIL